MVFEKGFRGKRYTLSVVDDGQRIGYKVGNMIYRSPSAAAKSITGSAVNGWLFWNIDT
jgi:replication-associated recombination protein RarA